MWLPLSGLDRAYHSQFGMWFVAERGRESKRSAQMNDSANAW
jgi:hypothetical protein